MLEKRQEDNIDETTVERKRNNGSNVLSRTTLQFSLFWEKEDKRDIHIFLVTILMAETTIRPEKRREAVTENEQKSVSMFQRRKSSVVSQTARRSERDLSNVVLLMTLQKKKGGRLSLSLLLMSSHASYESAVYSQVSLNRMSTAVKPRT